MVVGVAQNLIPKEQRGRAQNVLSQLVKLIGEEVKYPTKLVLIRSGTNESIVDTAAALHDGRLHLAVLNGLEYGWLREQTRGRVKCLVSSSQDIQVVQYEELIVRKDSGWKIHQLQGASLVLYKEPYPSLTIYLQQLEEARGRGFLNNRLEPVANGSRALQAVVAGKADATIVDLYTIQGYKKVFPGQFDRLQVLERSAAYPLAPVAGEEQQVNRLRPNLWRDLQQEMTEIHRNPRARAFLDVWRVRGFALPTAEYEAQAAKAAQQFPLSELPAVRPR